MNESATTASGQEGLLAALYRRRWVRVVTLVLAIPTLLALVFGIYLWQRFGTDRPTEYADIEQHFKYGSTGGEHESGFPYWIFQALPQVCAEHLPGKGYASLGLIYEEGHDLPVGMSKRHHQGIDKTFLNCAVCHASTVRDAPNSKPRVYLGMPAMQLDIMGFEKFLFGCAKDPKFAAEFVVPEASAANGQSRPARPIPRLSGRGGADARAAADARRPEFVFEHQVRSGRSTRSTQQRFFNFPMTTCQAKSKADIHLAASCLNHAAALGREQHDGRGTQQERGVRHRHDAADARRREYRAYRGVAADEGATEVSVSDRCGPGCARRRAVQGVLRRMPRRVRPRLLV
jgi:hypothetical protein